MKQINNDAYRNIKHLQDTNSLKTSADEHAFEAEEKLILAEITNLIS